MEQADGIRTAAHAGDQCIRQRAALLGAIGRVRYEAANDAESLAAVRECCESEGILPAIKSAHALAGARRWAAAHPATRILVGVSGRGDKDMLTLTEALLAPDAPVEAKP